MGECHLHLFTPKAARDMSATAKNVGISRENIHRYMIQQSPSCYFKALFPKKGLLWELTKARVEKVSLKSQMLTI